MPSKARTITRKVRKIISSLPFMMAVGFFVSYLLFGYYAVNPLAQKILPWVAENKLASRLNVERVSFDPLRLAVTVDKLRLTTPENSSLAGFEQLHADLELRGLFRFAWRLKDIKLSAPHVTFDVAPGGISNWSQLIAKLNENSDEEPSEGMARLLIDHILIERGDVEYIDRNRAETFRAVLEPLGLELDGFSTLPEDLGDYTILAKLPEQGGTLKWKGELGLNPVLSSGKVELNGLKLPSLLKVLPPDALPVRLDSGLLNTSLDYQFAMVQDKPQASLKKIKLILSDLGGTLLDSRDQKGHVGLQQLQLDLPALEFTSQPQPQVVFQGASLALKQVSLAQDGKALLELPQLSATDIGFDLLQHQLKVADLTLAQGKMHAVRTQDGRFDWQHLQAAVQNKPHSNESSVPASDNSDQPFNVELANINIQGWQADYLDQSFKQALALKVQDINLDLNLASNAGNLSVGGLNSHIGPVTLSSALYKEPAAVLTKLAVQGGKIDVAERKATLDSIVFSGLQAQVLKRDQILNWQAMLEPAIKAGRIQSAPAPVSNQDASAWELALKRLALENGAVHIEDSSTPTPVRMDIQGTSLEVQDVTLNSKRPLPLQLAFQVKQGGQFEAKGTFTPEPMQADFKLKLAGLSLQPLAPYVNQAALLKLNHGVVNSAGTLKLHQGKALAVAYKGGFSVNKLDIVEEEGGQAFLGWNSLATDNLELTLSPNKLHIGELRIDQPISKFIIYEDRSLNVTRILRDQSAQASTVPEAKTTSNAGIKPAANRARSVPATQPTAEPESFPVTVDRIRVDKANLEFADLSLTPQFGTYINSLSGVINGLSTNPSTTAQVELDGKVDDYGSARIRGSLQPFQATEFTDLKLVFQNLEMNRLTPYSGKFAGRRIDSGKLSVNLEYKIKHRQLAGENKFVLNKLRLGEKVDSKDAVNLPLDLAIALLEDSDGVIDMDLPVSGSLDDPEFSYGKIVWKAVVNVLGKIVTSPFRALGNLLGISSDKLESVVFDGGSAELAPPEQEKLKTIAQALTKRPALTLSIAPVVDDKVDGAALQEQFVRNQVAAKMGLKLMPGERPGPIDLSNKKVRAALDKLAKEQLKSEQVSAIRDSVASSEKDETVLYAKLQEQLVKNTVVQEPWLTALATARAASVKAYLLENAGLSADHLNVSAPVKQSGDGQAVNMKLDLGTQKNTGS
ncbi:DUF748 domain-containing protein [Methylobacillus gramineus]|uniref:DUF748 domain-containing protein n=1 Tax=Methylobacillus gramineus TaxID=755169 RepID=UPI001CFFFF00|nr:DUF748 domain-containing protein [Methylobacillus gramineus]MCB5184337.1 DUF748 domain-containing protein [Methylobacillus gramineus]